MQYVFGYWKKDSFTTPFLSVKMSAVKLVTCILVGHIHFLSYFTQFWTLNTDQNKLFWIKIDFTFILKWFWVKNIDIWTKKYVCEFVIANCLD